MKNKWVWILLIPTLCILGLVIYINQQIIQEANKEQLCSDNIFDDRHTICYWAHQATVGAVQKEYGCVYWDGQGGCLATQTPIPTPTRVHVPSCEEYRYIDGEIASFYEDLVDAETGDFTDDNYAIIQTLYHFVSYTVASHSCSEVDPSFDDDHFFWSQHAYHLLDILDHRFYDEKYLE